MPSPEQFAAYRLSRLNAVSRITRCIRAGIIPKTEWAISTVRTLREEQRASRRRQAALACQSPQHAIERYAAGSTYDAAQMTAKHGVSIAACGWRRP